MRLCLAVCILASLAAAQSPRAEEFGFEGTQRATGLRGWFEQPTGCSFADEEVVHSGRYSARLQERVFGTGALIMRLLAIDFTGKVVELRAWVRTEEVTGGLRLFLREEDQNPNIGYVIGQPVRETTGWAQYSLKLAIHPSGQRITYGFTLSGRGRAWIDDVELWVDGKPLEQTPKIQDLDAQAQ
jgi:hypothetical protein